MTANNKKFYFGYSNKLDEYKQTYHCSIGKKPVNTEHSI